MLANILYVNFTKFEKSLWLNYGWFIIKCESTFKCNTPLTFKE
jgi:hypothetical protein